MRALSGRLIPLVGVLLIGACSRLDVDGGAAKGSFEPKKALAAAAGAPDAKGSPKLPETLGKTAPLASTWTGMRVGTNFWFLSAGWAEDAWAPGVNFTTTLNPWNPAFIGDLQQANYAVYRFMDFGGTNNSPIRNWADRTQQTSQANLTAGTPGGRGIAYEWMFDLCNRMQKDCWITVPHLAIETYEANANDNFFISLATLAKQKLAAGRTLYVEYSNETWNPGFGQATYCQNRGMQMGMAGDAYGASFMFHVYASSRLYDAFARVYGADIGRVRWVVAGQLGSAYGLQKQIEALGNGSINLNARLPAFYAISNYVGADDSVDGNSPNMPQQFRAALTTMVNWATAQRNMIAGSGVKLISYEGGQHLSRGADAFSRNPAAYTLYKEWLDASANLYALTMHYSNSGAWIPTGAWGAKEQTGGALSTNHKARALTEWIAAHPAQ